MLLEPTPTEASSEMFITSTLLRWLLVSLLMVLFSGFGSTETDVDFDWNNLGKLAQACSSKHCQAGVTGLDFWVSLNEVRGHGVVPWSKRTGSDLMFPASLRSASPTGLTASIAPAV